MKLKHFLLEEWLEGYAESPMEFSLGGSTGPVWTIKELLALDGPDSVDRMLASDVVYSRASGSTALRRAIAQMQDVPIEHVLVVLGASEALDHIFYSACEPGANVIVPAPSYPPHQALPEALGLEVRCYQLRREDAYKLDLDEIRRLADSSTKVILVNSPHNPTGSVIDAKTMDALHDFTVERGIQLVSDEVYHPIYHDVAATSASRLPHATVVGDLSKAFALSGLRIGWIVEPDAGRRARYLTTREYYTISNPPVTEFLGEVAVRHRDVILKRTREDAQANLKLLELALAQHADVIRWIPARGGMTGFPWLESGEDTRPFCERAVRRGLLVSPGDCFGEPNHFRIGFGVGRNWYPRAMERLAEVLRDSARPKHTVRA